MCPTHQWVSKEQSGLGRSLWKKDCGEEEERNPIAKEMNFHITEEHIQSCMRTAVKNGVEMRRFLSLQTPHTGNKGEQEHTLLEYRTSWDSRLQHTGKPSSALVFVQLCKSSRKSNINGMNLNHFFLIQTMTKCTKMEELQKPTFPRAIQYPSLFWFPMKDMRPTYASIWTVWFRTRMPLAFPGTGFKAWAFRAASFSCSRKLWICGQDKITVG